MNILFQNLASVSAHLTTHAPLLNAMAIYPLPSFPGREQENLLQQLVRKKLDPSVEDWVEQGRREGEEIAAMNDGGGARDITELWKWAGPAANDQATEQKWGGDYTLEEIEGGMENVTTGLVGGDVSDEDEEDDKMAGMKTTRGPEEVEGPAMSMGEILKFLAKGEETTR